MTPSLSATIERAVALSEAATPGPWKPDRNWWITGPSHNWERMWHAPGINLLNYRREDDQRICHIAGPSEGNHAEADQEFIVAARELLPKLAEGCRALGEENEKLRGIRGAARDLERAFSDDEPLVLACPGRELERRVNVLRAMLAALSDGRGEGDG